MKKLLSISFILVLALGLNACNKPSFLQKEEVQKVVVKENPAKKDYEKKKDKVIENKEKLEKDTEGKEEILDESAEKNIEKNEEDMDIKKDEEPKKEKIKKKSEPQFVAQQTLLILDAS